MSLGYRSSNEYIRSDGVGSRQLAYAFAGFPHLKPLRILGLFLLELPLFLFPQFLRLLLSPSGQLLLELALRRLFLGLEGAEFCSL